MSLSFVSKSVQTTTEDGGFVEEAIEGTAETDTAGTHKPLFEQLRANQEQAEAEQEEHQKALMRGTLALDEEDAAHLESLRRKEREQHDEVHRRTEEELAAFRAARADRSGTETTEEPEQSLAMDPPQDPEETAKIPAKPRLAAPQIRIKRKRRREAIDNKQRDASDKKPKPPDDKGEDKTITSKNKTTAERPKSTASEPGLGSLLGGYGSSSDED